MGYIVEARAVRCNRIILFQRECYKCKELYFFNISETKTEKCFVCECCEPTIPEDVERVNGTGGIKVVSSRNVIYSLKIEKNSTKNFKKILRRDGMICQYCYEEGFTVDHIIPRTAGGSNNINNLICACSKCNSIAGNKIFETFDDKLKYIMQKRH